MMLTATGTERTLRSRLGELLSVAPHLREATLAAERVQRLSWPMKLLLIVMIPQGILVVAIGPIALAWLLQSFAGPVQLFAIVGYLSTAWMFGVAWDLHEELRRSPAISDSFCVPASDRQVARRVWNKLLVESLLGTYLLVYMNGVIAYQNGFDAIGWMLAIALGIVQGLFVIAAGTWLALSLPQLLHGTITVVMLLALPSSLTVPGFPWVDAFAWALVVLPGSWSGACLWEGYMNGNPLGWCALVPVVAATVGIWWLRQRLIAAYHVAEFNIEQGAQPYAIIDGPLARGTGWNWPLRRNVEEADRKPQAEAVQWIRNHEESRADWTTIGWMERLLATLLSPRERTIVEAVEANQPEWSWSARFGSQLMWTLAVLAMPFLFGLRWAAVPAWAVLFAFVSFFIGIGSKQMQSQGLPLSTLPILAGEYSRTMFKVEWLRSLLHGVLVLPVFVAGFGTVGLMYTLFAVVGFKILLSGLTEARLGSQAKTTFWKRLGSNLLRLLIHAGTAACIVMCAWLGRGSLVWASVAVAAALGCSHAARAYCAWRIDSGRVDLA